MAKKNNSKRNQKDKQKKQRPARVMGAPRGALDAPAAAHARLLMDPCGQPLTHPIYAGGDGGLLFRAERTFTWFGASTETAGILGFVPGASFGPGGGSVYVNTAALTTDTQTSVLNRQLSLSPGQTFLANNSRAFRPVAACLQVSWPGSELNRQGFVAMGRTSGAELDEAVNTGISVSGMRDLATATMRMPQDHMEILWKPGAGDALFADPDGVTQGGFGTQRQAVFAAVSGIPVGVGVRFRMVTVFEYVPKSGLGMGSAIESRARSANSLDDVLNTVDRLGINAVKVGHAAYNFVHNVGVGAMGAYNALRGAKALTGAARLAIMAA